MKSLATICPGIGMVVTSPLTRASQTADLLKKRFKNAELRVDDRLVPGGDWRSLVDEVMASAGGQAVAIVGHDPQVSTLVASLCSNGANSEFVALDKGGAAALRRNDERGWTLDWLATRQQLEQMK